MSKPDIKNLPASILDRLMTQSRITGLNAMLNPSLLREMGFIFLTWANQEKFSIRRFGKMEAILSNEVQIGVTLDEDAKSRVSSFLETIDCILWEILSPEQRILYENQRCIKMYADYGMTPNGYTTFLNACSEVVQLTGLPFSLEEDFQGLKTWDAWNDAVEAAIEKAKREMQSIAVVE